MVSIERGRVTLRKAKQVLFSSKDRVHVSDQQWVGRGSPLLTLTYQRLLTEDIVSGIPKIEQLFEARKGKEVKGSPKAILQELFEGYRAGNSLPQAVRQSVSEVQALLVEGVQKVYLSQGVLISDKHVEIIIRGMTSRGNRVRCR